VGLDPFKQVEHLPGLRFFVDLVGPGRVADHTLAVNDEDRSSAPIASVVDHVVQTRDVEVLVANVWEVDASEAISEPAMRVDVVVADGDNLSTGVQVLLIVRPKGG
jgi:hypothetical protein